MTYVDGTRPDKSPASGAPESRVGRVLDRLINSARQLKERTRELAQANEALREQIAARHAAEAHVRALAMRLVSATEDERRRIAHELHDTFGQQLSLMQLQLAVLRRQAEQQPAASTQLAQIDRLFDSARELDEALDRVESRLRPPALDELGLEAALAQAARAWTADSGIPIALQDGGLRDVRLPPQVETTVYRVVQEALANVRRHAHAHRVVLNIRRDEDGLRVSIADDGRGFEQGVASSGDRGARHLGLVGMRERAALVSGALDIESRPGRGATITLRIPLPGPPAH
jgi:signal transduction histidine kinase